MKFCETEHFNKKLQKLCEIIDFDISPPLRKTDIDLFVVNKFK